MKKIWLFLPALLLGGCTARTPEMAAGYTDDPAVMESGDAWKKAAAYDLYGAAEQFRDAHPDIRRLYVNKVQCPGKVSLLYDSRYLYVHAERQDDDLVAESDGDQVMLCNFGDVFEIFLKPADANHYWEIHISPKNQKLVLFYPGRGYHFLPSVGPRKKSPLPGLKSSVRLNGTLNRRMDKDRSWSVTVAIPLAELAAQGIGLKPGSRWKILTARYNYSSHQPNRELTTCPQLKKLNFHAHEEYAELILKDAE